MEQQAGRGGTGGTDEAGGAGGDVLFRERLLPGPGVWLVLIGLGLLLGIVVLPLGPAVGVVAAVLGVVVLVTLGWMSGALVVVTRSQLQAGRAVIGREFVGAVEALDTEAMRVGRGTGLDARAFLCLRGWVATGVRVRLTDPDDPAPYWLVSSRRPDELAAALRG